MCLNTVPNIERWTTSEQLKKATVVALKAASNSLHRIRLLESAVFFTVMLPMSHPIIVASLAAGKSYSEQARSKGKGHNLGSPHLYVWMAAVTAAVGCKMCKGEAKQILTDHSTAVGKDATPDKLALISGLIPQFRTKQCRKDPTNGDQSSEVEGKALLRAFIKTVIAEGGVLHSGMGPSTGLERDCQRHIEELTQ